MHVSADQPPPKGSVAAPGPRVAWHQVVFALQPECSAIINKDYDTENATIHIHGQ